MKYNKAERKFCDSSMLHSQSHRAKREHFEEHCEIQAHLQLWPLFAQHKGSTSGLSNACAAFHCSIQTSFYSDVTVRAQEA